MNPAPSARSLDAALRVKYIRPYHYHPTAFAEYCCDNNGEGDADSRLHR